MLELHDPDRNDERRVEMIACQVGKWAEEEKEMLGKCTSVSDMLEVMGEEEVKAMGECVAEVYALLDVVGVGYTLSEEKKRVVAKLIGCWREAKRKETGLCGRVR